MKRGAAPKRTRERLRAISYSTVATQGGDYLGPAKPRRLITRVRFVNTIINREAGVCTLRIIQPTP